MRTHFPIRTQNVSCAVTQSGRCKGKTACVLFTVLHLGDRRRDKMCPFTRPPLSFRPHQGLKTSRSLQAIRTHATNTAQNHCNTLLGCLVWLGTATGFRTRSSLELSSASIACILNRGLCRKRHIDFNHYHKYRDSHVKCKSTFQTLRNLDFTSRLDSWDLGDLFHVLS